MTLKRENVALAGVGAVACAACCAGPILGVLTAIGISTAAGAALFGTVALAVGMVAALAVLRRRRQASPCQTAAPVAVAPPTLRTPR